MPRLAQLALLLSTLAGAARAAALPRADCAALGTGASSSAPGRFTLTARAPATNASTPRFVRMTGAVPQQSWSVLMTTPDSTFANLSLANGALSAYANNPYFAPTAAIGLTTGDSGKYGVAGPFPTFATNGAVPDTAFCAVDNVLALNGRTDLFSLCDSYFRTTSGVTVVYDADPAQQPDEDSYRGASCVPVQLVIVPE